MVGNVKFILVFYFLFISNMAWASNSCKEFFGSFKLRPVADQFIKDVKNSKEIYLNQKDGLVDTAIQTYLNNFYLHGTTLEKIIYLFRNNEIGQHVKFVTQDLYLGRVLI